MSDHEITLTIEGKTATGDKVRVECGREKFTGKPVYVVTVYPVDAEPPKMVAEAIGSIVEGRTETWPA